jgi:tetratricopeptide (TPR) repeat protein
MPRGFPFYLQQSAATDKAGFPRSSSSVSASGYRHRFISRLGRLLAVAILIGLAAFNFWWYWRDTRPLPDLETMVQWLAREEYVRGTAALREHLRRSPHDATARAVLARMLAGQGDLLGCAHQLHQVPFWSPEKPEALYREGQAYLQIDRAKDAEAAWLELIKEDLLHPVDLGLFDDACLALLELYATEDRWDDAYSIIWSAYDHAAPADRKKWLGMRMRAELERISPKVSLERLQRYVATDPYDWEALRALAGAELALGMRDAAEERLKVCLRGRPEDARAWRDYAAMLLEQGNLDSFLPLLKQAPTTAENEPEAWFFRAVAAEKAADWTTAAAHLQKALGLNPYVSKYHYRLATAQEHLGRRKEALEHRRRTKELNEARVGLRTAYSDYISAGDAPGSPGADLFAKVRRLASICETLGWARAAEAWNRLANSS